jgi:hypothetical protein
MDERRRSPGLLPLGGPRKSEGAIVVYTSAAAVRGRSVEDLETVDLVELV